METMQGPDGATVEALIEGDGDEAVVFVHASASGIAQWRAYQHALSDRYVTAAVHLYGYGATTPWGGPHRQRLADQAGLVGTVIQAIGRPAHVVGHSFGGASPSRPPGSAGTTSCRWPCTNQPCSGCCRPRPPSAGRRSRGWCERSRPAWLR